MMPDQLPGDILDAGLAPEHVGLIAEAWAESSRFQLDGRLHISRARKLRGWDEPRARALVIAGALVSTADRIDLVGYLGANRSREQINALREAQARGGQKGGRAAADRAADGLRLPDGTLPPSKCPLHDAPWRKGKYGFSCPSKANPGEPANHRGYCTMTPDKARDTRVHSGGVSGTATATAPTGAVSTVSTEASTADAAPPLGFVSGWGCIHCGERVQDLANNHTVTDPKSGQTARLHGDHYVDAFEDGCLVGLDVTDFDQYGEPMREPS